MLDQDRSDRVLDRLDRLVDRLDRVVDRLDSVRDHQDHQTRLLKEIRTMTSANGDTAQAIVDAVTQLDAELTAGLTDVNAEFDSLQSTIANLQSLNDSDKNALSSALSAVQGQLSRTTQAFSRFKENPDTPVDPTPVPEPAPVEPGPVAPSDGGDGSGFQFGS